MNVSATIPATVQIKRGHLIGLVVGAAAVAAAVTWAVSAFAFDTGTASTQESVSAQETVLSSPIPVSGYLDAVSPEIREHPLGSAAIPATGYLDAVTSKSSAREQKALQLVNSLTPAQLRSIRYYWTPSTTQLGPREQRALDLVNSLTPAELRGIRYYWTPNS